ncbi:unnamed protein product [Ostreobium quekettii]|uniref:t-SNARE coiled-coil homology domain-containing protein n=1 Tax=Ostreobium quekettii TaxID=121088 RepID=A0A8S1IY44_9CHLO|nr:unnamed protein product [Ostreobium quekettii]CAD7699655.1 unnamed protein product [Ostreobium quekettii]
MAAYHSHSLRDRTGEFFAIADRLQKQQGAASTSGSQEGTAGPGVGSRAGAGVGQSEFARRASTIGMGIHRTSAKLQSLAALARRTSMFDDPAREIAELSGMIKADITRLNADIAELQVASAARDGGTNVQSLKHSNTVVDDLRVQLKDTTKEFQDVLSLRTDNLKGQDNRRKRYSSAGGKQNGFMETQPLLRQPVAHGPGRSAHNLFGGEGGKGPSGSTAITVLGDSRQPQQQQQQQLAVASPQNSYLDSRATALHTAEATIVELGGIFQQLAHMVAEHGEMAKRIEDDVVDTDTNVMMAQTQLLKYLNGISSNRWLIMKVFMVLMAFVVIFVFLL